jgi:hypothetical protein
VSTSVYNHGQDLVRLISRLLHHLTSFASPPLAPKKWCGECAKSRRQHDVFESRRYRAIDGFASALFATENSVVSMDHSVLESRCCLAHPLIALSDETLKFGNATSASGVATIGAQRIRRIRRLFRARYVATRRCVVMDDTKPPSAQRWTDRTSAHAGGMRNS